MLPCASAGSITSAMCCAREPNISAISASGESPAVAESSNTLRIFSPVSVPPGSRVSTTLCPAARTTAASFRSCVLLPVPSSPSNVMNFPRRDILPNDISPLSTIHSRSVIFFAFSAAILRKLRG
jgi:hypothetical protein